jgi:hypothetical protein
MFWAWAGPDPRQQKQRAKVSLIFITTPHDKTTVRLFWLHAVSSMKGSSTMRAMT